MDEADCKMWMSLRFLHHSGLGESDMISTRKMASSEACDEA